MLVYSSARKGRVGTQKGAAAAIRGDLPHLGTGCYKVAFISPERVVYKLAHSGRGQIAAEATAAAVLRAKGVPGIPPVSVYRVDGRLVLAMPLYEVDYEASGYLDDKTFRTWLEAGVEDVHDDNIGFDRRGRPFVIDLSGFRWSADMEQGWKAFLRCDDDLSDPSDFDADLRPSANMAPGADWEDS